MFCTSNAYLNLVRPHLTRFFWVQPNMVPNFWVRTGQVDRQDPKTGPIGLTSQRVQIRVQPYNVLSKPGLKLTHFRVGYGPKGPILG